MPLILLALVLEQVNAFRQRSMGTCAAGRRRAARRSRMTRRAGKFLRAVALLAGALLRPVSGCGTGSSGLSGEPGVPGATGAEATTTENLQKFFGNGLVLTDRGSFGIDRGQLIATPDAPGGTMLRVAYPAGSASRRADGEDGGMQAYLTPARTARRTSSTCTTSSGSSRTSTSSRGGSCPACTAAR